MDAKEIIATRKAAGLSQRDFAKTVSCSKSSVHYWETGRRTPDREHENVIREIQKDLKKRES